MKAELTEILRNKANRNKRIRLKIAVKLLLNIDKKTKTLINRIRNSIRKLILNNMIFHLDRGRENRYSNALSFLSD